MEETESSNWSKLPIALQHQFFAHAEKAAEKCRKRIEKQRETIKKLKGILKFSPLPSEKVDSLRVAFVDGSWLTAKERLGIRVGVYAAGYMVFQGDEIAENGEGYKCGWLVEDQVGDPWETNKILDLLCTNLEREAALHCLEEEDVDFVVIDGNFYGFRVRCCEIMGKELDVEGFRNGEDLVKHVRDLTTRLARSGRCVGVMKRVRLASIDGWILKNLKPERCTNQNDRMILSLIMPESSLFSYETLFGEGSTWLDCLKYSQLKHLYDQYRGQEDIDKLWEKASQHVHNTFLVDLKCKPEKLPTLKRLFVRHCEAPPYCLEIPKDVDVQRVASYLLGINNPATGLPLPLDLIDQNITLPNGFSKEFLDEIEALLLKDSKLDEKTLLDWFSSINPQKEE